MHDITAMFTCLTAPGQVEAATEVGVSSLMDTWVEVRNVESNRERTRELLLLKSRGMSHSNEVREFILSDDGIQLVNVFVENGQVLTGRARRTAGERFPQVRARSTSRKR
jgi:circadian clock protein KaiC